jgi:hypothetical protein
MANSNIGMNSTRRDSSLKGFHVIFFGIFIVFLLLALVSMVCAQSWRTLLPGAEGANSMLDGVKSAVYTVISQLS